MVVVLERGLSYELCWLRERDAIGLRRILSYSIQMYRNFEASDMNNNIV